MKLRFADGLSGSAIDFSFNYLTLEPIVIDGRNAEKSKNISFVSMQLCAP